MFGGGVARADALRGGQGTAVAYCISLGGREEGDRTIGNTGSQGLLQDTKRRKERPENPGRPTHSHLVRSYCFQLNSSVSSVSSVFPPRPCPSPILIFFALFPVKGKKKQAIRTPSVPTSHGPFRLLFPSFSQHRRIIVHIFSHCPIPRSKRILFPIFTNKNTISQPRNRKPCRTVSLPVRDVPTPASQPETIPEKKAIADNNSQRLPFFPRRNGCKLVLRQLSLSLSLTQLHDIRRLSSHHPLTTTSSVLGSRLLDETRRTRKLPPHAKPSLPPTSTLQHPKLPSPGPSLLLSTSLLPNTHIRHHVCHTGPPPGCCARRARTADQVHRQENSSW